MDGAIQEEITPELEQKLDVEPFLNNVPQSESAGNTACALDIFRPFSSVFESLDVIWPMKTLVSSVKNDIYTNVLSQPV